MVEGLLEGVRVLDLSQDIAGSFCARLLADYGAEVLKLEPPGGAALRRMGPFYRDDPHPEKSLIFFILNLNKLGVTLNIKSEGGKKILKELARDADVIVETAKPGYMASLGLAYDELEELNPGLVLTSITPFGQYGPYSQYDGEEIVSYAMGAIMSISGTRDRSPLKHGGFQAQYEAGLNAAAATSMALFLQGMTGEGQHLDISTTECVSSTMIANQTLYPFTGAIQTRSSPAGSMFGHPMPCADGWVIAQTGGGADWNDVARFFDRPQLLEPRFAGQARSTEYDRELDAVLLDAIKDRGKRELFRTASEMRMLFGLVQTPEDLARCPQLKAREFFREVDHPVMGKLMVPAVLFNLSLTPFRLRRPAPLLGQHNVAVYCDRMGYTAADLVHRRQLDII
jgi:crotonobetainyl-CoA:carnitine CoA-transferase CaiB-like acyl-CoA transferase